MLRRTTLVAAALLMGSMTSSFAGLIMARRYPVQGRP